MSHAPLTETIDGDAPPCARIFVAHRDGRSGISEAYRGLRTSILLSNPGRPPRLIVLTSALPEDGKTATALNLAVVLAQLGRKVLLVDTDLRRPTLHKLFGLDNRRGLSDLFLQESTDPTSLLQPTAVDGLSILPSGPLPKNPPDVLGSKKMGRIVEALKEQVDMVLFDSPPVLGMADASLLAAQAENAVLVLDVEQTRRDALLRRVREELDADAERAGPSS